GEGALEQMVPTELRGVRDRSSPAFGAGGVEILPAGEHGACSWACQAREDQPERRLARARRTAQMNAIPIADLERARIEQGPVAGASDQTGCSDRDVGEVRAGAS